MVGIVIATHGTLADGLMDAVNLIIGEQEDVFTLGLKHGDDISEFGEHLVAGIEKVDHGEGVIVFTDLFGASPYNQAAMAKRKLDGIPYQLITGVNLPMLIQAFNDRILGLGLDEMKASSFKAGTDGVVDFFAKFANKQ
ncbi:PTS sugar transporter subunit IIA [Lactiplantibacillus daowaiensis]|uniref:PTS sugar transporter subunit IIA n=1 Tax=Lactiplantibacillus daowaiensis TaxID=2559918 RepID=A0ABW1S1N5_9LACO|nr:PTS sugar transporter subunit IIA [Lactiplantibacillus daowaiensis]